MGTQRSEETQEILDSFRRIVRVLRESSRAAENRVGLSGAQLFVMSALKKEPQLSINELAERTHTHQSTVSVVVSRLVERGLVARTASAEDGRRLILKLTPEGRALLKRAPDAAQERLVAAIDSLAAAERRKLSSLMAVMVEQMELADQPPGMFFDE
jgi:DNA-binding MarR family transcriptional regulator